METSPWWPLNDLSAGQGPALVFAHFTPLVWALLPTFIPLWTLKTPLVETQTPENKFTIDWEHPCFISCLVKILFWGSQPSISHLRVSVSEFPPHQQKIFYFPHTRNKCFIFPTLPYLKTTTIFMFLNLPGTWCWKNNRQNRKIPACKGCLVLIILPKKLKDFLNGNTTWTTLAER